MNFFFYSSMAITKIDQTFGWPKSSCAFVEYYGNIIFASVSSMAYLLLNSNLWHPLLASIDHKIGLQLGAV